MATAVLVMDRGDWEANTDNIAVVDPAKRSVCLVPRDLWAEPVRHRVNRAYARGGHDLLAECLAELGLPVQHSLCVRREATERMLAGVEATVPVEKPLRFWYPLDPVEPIEEGRKPVDFEPPEERLKGERIHQWLGARFLREGISAKPDVDRLWRQTAFVRALLDQGFDFAAAIEGEEDMLRVSSPQAFTELGMVDSSWRFGVLDDVGPAEIEGMLVLVRKGDARPGTGARLRGVLRALRRRVPAGRGAG